MTAWTNELSPVPDDSESDRRQSICDWWNQLRVCEETGTASLDVLDELERQVTECLYGSRDGLVKAESLTALAQLMVAGYDDL